MRKRTVMITMRYCNKNEDPWKPFVGSINLIKWNLQFSFQTWLQTITEYITFVTLFISIWKSVFKKHNTSMYCAIITFYTLFQFFEEFLQYLRDWKASVDAREGFSKSEKAKMFLSPQTYTGIVMTGKRNMSWKVIQIQTHFLTLTRKTCRLSVWGPACYPFYILDKF